MANPYFDEVYPVTEPERFNISQYGLPIFRPDSILTADQLNLLFGFLLSQEQYTRTRLIGVGIVCGLRPSLNGTNTITVSTGCGVTSEGDLLSLDATTAYDRFSEYAHADHPYQPFTAVNGLRLWELFPRGFTPDTNSQRVLTTLDQFATTTALALSTMVVLLYLESVVKSGDKCTGVACDAKGRVVQNQLRVLLVRRADANALIATGLRQAAAACTRLPVLTVARVRLDNRPYDQSLQRFQRFLQSAAGRLGAGLRDAYALINEVDPVGISSMTAPTTALQTVTQTISRNANCQYVYDWLKDLHDAYNEFREATCHWLVQCMPPADAFPKHLLAGELVTEPGHCQPQFRHAWVQSPAVSSAADARRKALWLYRRLLSMIELFKVPDTRFDSFSIKGRATVTTLISLKITPDRYRKSAVDQRAMPFYYQPTMRVLWSYERAKHCRTAYIHSYHLPEPALPEIQNPFAYAIETYPFYRIEGFVGAGVLTTLSEVLAQRRTHNLAFDVLALRVDTDQLLVTQEKPFDFTDLTIDFDDILSQIHCHEAEANTKITPLAVVLPMAPAVFTKILTGYELLVKRLEVQRLAQCILSKLPLLRKLKETYEKRKAAFESNLTFGPFLSNHPGLEHGAGVPQGGTFVLVYKDPAVSKKDGRQRKGGESVVIADFYLPYRCCGAGNGVQFVLPEPPPTLEMPETFCLGAPKAKITVSPNTGSFDSPLVTKTGRTFFFNPTAVGTHTLTYTVPDRPPVFVDVQVLPLPKATFITEKTGKNKFLFHYKSANASKLIFDYGDGSQPETIEINANPNGQRSHQFSLRDDGSGQFEVKLTATNGNCDQAEPFSERIVFEKIIKPSLAVDPVVCFDDKNQLEAKGSPPGGTYSSSTGLIIDPGNGKWRPNLSGEHKITYTLDSGEEEAKSVFVLPDSFEIKDIVTDVGKPSDFTIVILTPPDGFTYKWEFGQKQPGYSLLEPADVKRAGRSGVAYVFKNIKFSTNDEIRLSILDDKGKRKCAFIIQVFPK